MQFSSCHFNRDGEKGGGETTYPTWRGGTKNRGIAEGKDGFYGIFRNNSYGKKRRTRETQGSYELA